MKYSHTLFTAFIFAVGLCSVQVFAADTKIDAADFVDEASAKGMAEIETGELALEKGSAKTREFAQKMIDYHRMANDKLAELATKNNLEVSDEAGLMDKAKTLILQVRDESFDGAYASNQVEAHQEAIDLFQRAANSELGELSEYARETLPKLENHLEMARELEANVSETTR